jgi:hypothetical protein
MTVFTTAYALEWKPSGSWLAVDDDDVAQITGSLETAQADGGVGFGTTAVTRATVQVLRTAVSGLALARMPVRFTFTVGASSEMAFVGFVRGWSGDRATVTLECSGMLDDLPERTKNLYSPLYYRRHPATKTTASSIENPATGGYAAGLINWMMWYAGGRPFEQAGSYPSADFYYSFHNAIRAPDWTWIAGEDGWSVALQMIRAVGGKLKQGPDGVIYYTSPLTMLNTPTKTFTTDDYEDVAEQGNTDQYAATITVSYLPRSPQPTQEVINDTTIRAIAAGETVTIYLDPQWPLFSTVLDGGTLKMKNITATYYDGAPVVYGSGITTTTTVDAQRITLTVTNSSSRNFQITKILVSGSPIAAGEAGSVTVGSGAPTKVLEDNPYVQSEAHALALAEMGLDFYGVARAVRTLTGCVYDPDRTADETVNLTDSLLGLSAAPHLITSITSELGEGGAITGSYALLDAANLPELASYWIVSTSAQSGTKLIAW